jgi:hypothetical protein
VVDRERSRPDIFFLKVPEAKAGKNRVHLDIKVARGLEGDARRTRIESEAERLVALGAAVADRVDTAEGFHLVLRDVEGNEFCMA